VNDFPDSQPFPRIDVDMNQVTREAMGLRVWRCEFACQGMTFLARVEAANEAAAHSLARHELRGVEGFSSQFATLIACVEV
jgi:hypothetical protein